MWNVPFLNNIQRNFIILFGYSNFSVNFFVNILFANFFFSWRHSHILYQILLQLNIFSKFLLRICKFESNFFAWWLLQKNLRKIYHYLTISYSLLTFFFYNGYEHIYECIHKKFRCFLCSVRFLSKFNIFRRFFFLEHTNIQYHIV